MNTKVCTNLCKIRMSRFTEISHQECYIHGARNPKIHHARERLSESL